jgi:hypothetical protein
MLIGGRITPQVQMQVVKPCVRHAATCKDQKHFTMATLLAPAALGMAQMILRSNVNPTPLPLGTDVDLHSSIPRAAHAPASTVYVLVA